MKIVFMGTPKFSVPTLEKIIASNHEVVAVYTKPPKPAGRGKQELKSPVHLLSEQYSIPISTPNSLRSDQEAEKLSALKPDVVIVVAYGLILPRSILDIPKICALNLHPSKLPRWRGAAPLQRTILAGDKESGVCIMKMDEGMDTGDVFLKHEFSVSEEMTIQELSDYTSNIGAEMMVRALDILAADPKHPSVKQTEEGVVYADKLKSEDEIINWHQPVRMVNCQIRAFSPKPGAYFRYKGEVIKIIVAEYEEYEHSFTPGLVIDDHLTVACSKGVIKPQLLQRQGRKMIYTDAFLRGFPIKQGTILGGIEEARVVS